MYYVDKLWLSEGHVFFTIMALLGLPFCWSHRGFRYVFAMLVSLWILSHQLHCGAFSPLLLLLPAIAGPIGSGGDGDAV